MTPEQQEIDVLKKSVDHFSAKAEQLRRENVELRKVADAAVANVKAVRAWRQFVWIGSDAGEKFKAIALDQMESREKLEGAVAEYLKFIDPSLSPSKQAVIDGALNEVEAKTDRAGELLGAVVGERGER